VNTYTSLCFKYVWIPTLRQHWMKWFHMLFHSSADKFYCNFTPGLNILSCVVCVLSWRKIIRLTCSQCSLWYFFETLVWILCHWRLLQTNFKFPKSVVKNFNTLTDPHNVAAVNTSRGMYMNKLSFRAIVSVLCIPFSYVTFPFKSLATYSSLLDGHFALPVRTVLFWVLLSYLLTLQPS
jgi:hypothetical protein